MAFSLLFVIMISASLHRVCIGLPIGQGAVGQPELEVVEEEEMVAKRQILSGLNQYLMAIFLNWRSFRAQQCNVTYNDQQVSHSLCDATLAKGNGALDSDEYDDCKGTFKMNVSSGPVTAVELALYKLPSSGKDMTKLYYVFIQYGTKRSTLYVPGSALGWQVVALQGATSEASDAGELDVLVAVYTGGSGFLLCSAVKSVFSVVGSGDYSPMLAVYTNASSSNNNSTNSSTNNINSSSSDGDGGGGALVYDTQNQNHSYIAFVSSARSECDTKPTRICYSNVNFSFKTFNRAKSLELDFAIQLGKYERAIGAELALHLNSNTQNNTYTVYLYRKVSPLQFSSIASMVLPTNRAGWQVLKLDSLVGGFKTNAQTKISLLIQVVRSDPGRAQTSLSPSNVHALLNLDTDTDYSPIVMAYVQSSNPCSYILCRREASTVSTAHGAVGEGVWILAGKGRGKTGAGGSSCQIEDRKLDLRIVYPDIVYPRVANVGRCTNRRGSGDPASDGNGSSPLLEAGVDGGSGDDGGGGGRCMPTRHSSLQTLHKREASYLLLDHPDLITTECSSS